MLPSVLSKIHVKTLVMKITLGIYRTILRMVGSVPETVIQDRGRCQHAQIIPRMRVRFSALLAKLLVHWVLAWLQYVRRPRYWRRAGRSRISRSGLSPDVLRLNGRLSPARGSRRPGQGPSCSPVAVRAGGP